MSMTEQTVRAAARCDDCSKVYRVPDPDRTYTCKACGGTVRAAGDPGAAPAPPRRAAAQLPPEALESLKQAFRTINLVTVVYRLGAVAYAIAALFAVVSLARPDVPKGGGILVVVVTTLVSVLLMLGAMHIQFRPVLWTVVIAVMTTVVTLVHAFGPNPFGVAFLGSAAWAALAWSGFIPSRKFSELMAEHKDYYILHHASSRTRRALKERTPQERHERLLGVMQEAALRAWKLSASLAGALCLLTLGGSYLVLSTMRPEEFAPNLESFQAAWNEGDLTDVGELFDPRVRGVESARLSGLLDGHGLREERPNLADGTQRRDGEHMFVDFELEELTVTASWTMTGRRWSLVRVDLPIPALEPTLEKFRAAWRGFDTQALAGFFAADAQATMLKNIEGAVEGRGWESMPTIIDTGLTYDAKGQASAIFALEKGNLSTEWTFRSDGAWRLHALRFPKR
jgi:hypothetical protein